MILQSSLVTLDLALQFIERRTASAAQPLNRALWCSQPGNQTKTTFHSAPPVEMLANHHVQTLFQLLWQSAADLELLA
jgi:hypothetical protein